MISHFIGGTNKQELYRVLQRCTQNRWIPIIDYAKEASTNKSDVVTYIKNMRELAGISPVYALKISSFAPFKPYETMDYVINYLKNEGATKILLDAETVALEDIETDIFNRLVQKHNVDTPFLYKTYQMYKRDTSLLKDIVELPHLGVKLVRGAYYEQDNRTGKLFSKAKETHLNYDSHLEMLVKKQVPLIVATHNKESIVKARNFDNIEFAQLLGMKDDLSTELAKTHKVYKYVPYGTMQEMMPYLLRRLNENRGILKHIF